MCSFLLALSVWWCCCCWTKTWRFLLFSFIDCRPAAVSSFLACPISTLRRIDRKAAKPNNIIQKKKRKKEKKKTRLRDEKKQKKKKNKEKKVKWPEPPVPISIALKLPAADWSNLISDATRLDCLSEKRPMRDRPTRSNVHTAPSTDRNIIPLYVLSRKAICGSIFYWFLCQQLALLLDILPLPFTLLSFLSVMLCRQHLSAEQWL